MVIVAYFDAASFALEASCPDFPMGCLMLHLKLFHSDRRIVSQEALEDEGTKYEGEEQLVRQMQVSLFRLYVRFLLVGG
jgi:hypothetical protein